MSSLSMCSGSVKLAVMFDLDQLLRQIGFGAEKLHQIVEVGDGDHRQTEIVPHLLHGGAFARAAFQAVEKLLPAGSPVNTAAAAASS